MSIRLTRPSTDALRSLMDAGPSDSLTYAPIGMSLHGHATTRYLGAMQAQVAKWA